MRDALVIVGSTLALLAALAVLTIVRDRPEPGPIVVSPRALDADPDFYKGSDVRLKTDGMETTDSNRELIFRRRTDQPPIAVFRFRDKVPERIPSHITGACIGRHGASVIVEDCRP